MIRDRKSSRQTLQVLQTLLDQPKGWRHGYDISLVTELQSGTLYPVLMRLSDRGYLESKWEPSETPGRPPRRLYRLTKDGVAYGKQQLQLAEDPSLSKAARGRA
jgi:PadR family transcriptional regulator, regulatory protein PadR